MKLLLIILLLPSICFSQKKDTLKSKWTEAIPEQRRREFNGEAIFSGVQSPTPKQDTIPVMLLICDTSDFDLATSEWIFDSVGNLLSKTITDEYTLKERGVYWRFGYAITEEKITTATGIYYHEPIYLDQNKKPLSKSIVVWLSKEIPKTKTN